MRLSLEFFKDLVIPNVVGMMAKGSSLVRQKKHPLREVDLKGTQVT